MNHRRRKGTSLLDTLVLGSLISLTLTSISVLTHRLLQSSRQITDAGQVRQVVARLQSRLWQDSTLATSSEVIAENGVGIWTTNLPKNRKLTYRIDGRTATRILTGAEGQVEHRDQFRLPPTFRFAATGDGAGFEIRIETERTAARGRTEQFEPTGLRVVGLASKSTLEAAP